MILFILLFSHVILIETLVALSSLNIFNCLLINGVGLQVLTTLVTARPLQYIYTAANMAYIKTLRYNKHVYKIKIDR